MAEGAAVPGRAGLDIDSLRSAAASLRHPLARVLLALTFSTGGLPVLAPIVSLVAFLVGAALGGQLVRRLAPRHVAHMTGVLGIETMLTGAAAILGAAVSVHPGRLAADVIIGVLALAMGVRNATARRLGVPDLTTTVLTLTLTGLAAESPAGGGRGTGTVRRVAAAVSMLIGALAGALLLKTSLALPLGLAALLALLSAAVYPAALARV